MCEWGTDSLIFCIRRNHPSHADTWPPMHPICVDSCIADYVQQMNYENIVTISCCCGHGSERAEVLIAPESADIMELLGYDFEVSDDGTLVHQFIIASGGRDG